MRVRPTGDKERANVARIVAFTSDFGIDDAWVGVCHAVIVARDDSLRVVDLSHDIPAYDIRKGAMVAASGALQLPDAVSLGVVDPGVGGSRRAVVVRSGQGRLLVGPDNGLLMPAALRTGGVESAWELDPERVGVPEPAPTFNARDLFAPAAAALALGADPASLGDPIDASTLVDGPFGPARREGGLLVGEVLDVDRFGSVRTNIAGDDMDALMAAGGLVEIVAGHTTLHVPMGRTFSDVGEGEPLALVDSTGWLALSVRGASAAERYGFEPGTPVRLRVD
jgi:S-adenosylmethionine hydrolase